jgi:phosphonate transport system substrate-binding protein
MMGPASYARAKNSDSEVTAFATITHRSGPFQEDGPSYRSLLIVRNDSRFNSLESLKGTRLVLVDPDSTSGAVIPRYLVSPMLRMPFENFFGRVAYSGGHDKSAKSIESRDSDAAFVASFLLADFISDGKGKKEDFRVIWQSDPIPLDPFVYRGTLCGPNKEQIKKVFLSNDGQAYPHLLSRISALRFTTINDDRYKTIREILQSPK